MKNSLRRHRGASACSHIDAVLRGPAHRQEVRHDEGHQVCAHLHCGVEVILQQTAWQLHRLYLRKTRMEPTK